MEDGQVRRILGLVAVRAAGANDRNRRRVFLHDTHLHGRGVSAQERGRICAQGAMLRKEGLLRPLPRALS